MSRQLGLGIDNVLEFRVVLANGTLLEHCNAQQHQELFGALRGAGSGNFGVVVRMHHVQMHYEMLGTAFAHNPLVWIQQRVFLGIQARRIPQMILQEVSCC